VYAGCNFAQHQRIGLHRKYSTFSDDGGLLAAFCNVAPHRIGDVVNGLHELINLSLFHDFELAILELDLQTARGEGPREEQFLSVVGNVNKSPRAWIGDAEDVTSRGSADVLNLSAKPLSSASGVIQPMTPTLATASLLLTTLAAMRICLQWRGCPPASARTARCRT